MITGMTSNLATYFYYKCIFVFIQLLENVHFSSVCILEFVDNHRQELIARVTSVMPVADGLRGKHMIPPEVYSGIDNARSRQTKIRLLFDVLDSGGPAVKAEFYRLIKDTEPCLVQDLES